MQFNNRNDERRHFLTLVSNVRGKINGDVELTRAYEEMGNLHDHVDSEGANLLHHSVHENHPQATQWLLDYGFEIDAQTTAGETALMRAVIHDRDEVFHVLLRASAKIDLVDSRGETALHKYNIREWMNMFRPEKSSVPLALLMKFIDKCETEEEVALKLFNFRCPLHLVLLLKNCKILELLLELGVDPNVRERHRQVSPLHLAVYIQDSESVELLLRYGADVNSQDSTGSTPISHMRPTREQNAEELKILKLLLDRGAKLTTAGGRSGFLQIFNVLRHGGEEALRLVLQTNIDLRARDRMGYTGLLYLAGNEVVNCTPDILKLIQNRPLDVNEKTYTDKWTALDFATWSGNARFVLFLLEYGADVNVPKQDGATTLFSAVMKCSKPAAHLTCVELLLEHGADIKNEIKMAIESVRRLVKSFNLYKQQLEELKKIVIMEPVTIFDLLMASKQKVLFYLRNQQFVLNLEEIGYKNKEGYYYKILRERIQIAFKKCN